jgi:hypothetical protein
MMNLLSNLICTAILSTTPVDNGTAPKTLSFDASAYVTINNQIRVAVEKNRPGAGGSFCCVTKTTG